jgi:hypothetical protein
MPDLLTTKEAAAPLGRSQHTLINGRREGRGPAYITFGRRQIRYCPEDIQKYIESLKSEPAQAPNEH